MTQDEFPECEATLEVLERTGYIGDGNLMELTAYGWWIRHEITSYMPDKRGGVLYTIKGDSTRWTPLCNVRNFKEI